MDPNAATDALWLADWRRRTGELYAEVRRLAADDPEAAWRHWRTTRERLFREHPQSPLPPEARADFVGRAFPYDPALRIAATVRPAEGPDAATRLALPASQPGPPPMRRLGTVELEFPGGRGRLSLFWLDEYAGGLFLPFRDATSGRETYGAGRYLLDTAKGADLGCDPRAGVLVLDLNFAYHPSCAFDPRWACPLAPPENVLPFPVEAGERLT